MPIYLRPKKITKKDIVAATTSKQVFDYVQMLSHCTDQLNLYLIWIRHLKMWCRNWFLSEYFLHQNSHEYPKTLLASPIIGVAAFNTNGHTLHASFQLPTQDKSNAKYRLSTPKSYKLLSDTFNVSIFSVWF